MFDKFFGTADELVRAGRPFATATVVRAEKPTSGKPGDRAIVTVDGTMIGWIGGSCAQPTVIQEALRAIADDRSRLIRLSPEPGTHPVPDGIDEVPMTCFSGGTLDIFIEPHQPRPRVLIVGSLPVAQSLAHLGRAMSYEVVAFDPTESEAMAHADEVIRDLDDIADRITPLTFVIVATHGDYDEPALVNVLSTDAPYVGLVASRKRGRAVLESLAGQGLGPPELERIRFPAGIDILARRGDEIALGIMAEIVKTRRSLETVDWATADEAQTAPGAPATDTDAHVPDDTGHGGLPIVTPAASATADRELSGDTATDPICGMTVKVAGAMHTHEHDGTIYYFCCGGCRSRFAADPAKHLAAAG